MPTVPAQAQETLRSLSKAYAYLAQLFNGRISFGNGTVKDNIDGVWVSVTTPIANFTDFTVTHNLYRIPVGYLVVKKSVVGDVFDGTVAATTTQYTLQSSGISQTLLIFFF